MMLRFTRTARRPPDRRTTLAGELQCLCLVLIIFRQHMWPPVAAFGLAPSYHMPTVSGMQTLHSSSEQAIPRDEAGLGLTFELQHPKGILGKVVETKDRAARGLEDASGLPSSLVRTQTLRGRRIEQLDTPHGCKVQRSLC